MRYRIFIALAVCVIAFTRITTIVIYQIFVFVINAASCQRRILHAYAADVISGTVVSDLALIYCLLLKMLCCVISAWKSLHLTFDVIAIYAGAYTVTTPSAARQGNRLPVLN